MSVTTVRVQSEDDGLRLDRWFKRHYPELPFGRLAKLLRTGQVRLDGKRAKAGDRIASGQEVRVPPLGTAKPAADAADGAAPAAAKRRVAPPSAEAEKVLADLRDRVLHKDDHVLVIDKPAGLAVQGGSKTRTHLDGLLDGLRFGASERPRLVHRLDKDTSGVLVLARTAKAAAFLTRAFKAKEVRKLYWTVVVGLPKPADGRIRAALAKLPGRGGERVVYDEDAGKPALTLYRTVEAAGRKAAWLAMEPRTGRTHQLRAHCMVLGTPIVGDGKYGGAQAFVLGDELPRQVHLHARALRLPHPAGGTLTLTAPLPAHMRATWGFLGFAETLAEEGAAADPFEAFDGEV